MKSHLVSPAIALCLVAVLCLFLFPWSPSPQPSGFFVSLDLDDAAGDQSVSSLDLLPDQPFSIQIFGRDIQGAAGMTARFGYDASEATYERFDAGGALPNAQSVARQDTTPCTAAKAFVDAWTRITHTVLAFALMLDLQSKFLD